MIDIVETLAGSAGVTSAQVRALLEALRNPPDEMVDAGIDASVRRLQYSDGAELAIWRAMIGRALNEGG